MNEYIKNLANDAVKKAVESYKVELEKFKRRDLYYLEYSGDSNGSALTTSFDFNLLEGKYCKIKSFEIIPYNEIQTTLKHYRDVSDYAETFYALQRLPLHAELYDPVVINFFINGKKIIFSSNAGSMYPLQFKIDNLEQAIPEQIDTIDINVTGNIFLDAAANNVMAAKIKVLIELYTYDAK